MLNDVKTYWVFSKNTGRRTISKLRATFVKLNGQCVKLFTKKKYRWLRVILYFHVFVLLVGLGFGVDMYYTNQKLQRVGEQGIPYEAIVVPGVPYYGVEISDLMRMRVLWACHLYQSGATENLIFSGSAVYSPYIEGEVMAAYAEKLGVPKHAIFIEPQAEHSTENIYYAYKMAKNTGFENIAITTDPVQSYFLKFFVNKHDIQINFLPFEFGMDSIFDVDLSEMQIDVSPQDPFIALPEREGFLKRFRGTLGKHIPRNAENKISVFEE